MERECNTNWRERTACIVLVGKPEGRRQDVRVDGITTDLRVLGWRGMNWTDVLREAGGGILVKTIKNFIFQ
jgi:hypothetical protein